MISFWWPKVTHIEAERPCIVTSSAEYPEVKKSNRRSSRMDDHKQKFDAIPYTHYIAPEEGQA